MSKAKSPTNWQHILTAQKETWTLRKSNRVARIKLTNSGYVAKLWLQSGRPVSAGEWPTLIDAQISVLGLMDCANPLEAKDSMSK